MGALFPSCAETTRRISEAADGPITPTARFALWLHLCACRFCRRYLKQTRFLSFIMHQSQTRLDRLSQPSLSVEARGRIADELRKLR